ncbi:hypothetical protein MXL46_13395 [Heyndrickxia sporothermodurans]|uniref:Uncharacterized protein n=2 Tax=Heyndrickxia TaxID=2837504 RepID=A0A150LA38_9BACI|nr:hypothetical protein [Heyndrickxia sporothermodurans]KYD08592.1 hypothetical protein B4102_0672 [Heyndrickxia sporothermodurans]MBL5766908.1 hypothetical protein [Heyndrickxia sporothermodurans]MBL5771554.1 hypothetical protein [Heyndrickxia sporothermodurans]MBL5773884.1 hypothetical protein [Heyndrickxia sporothermodurans]MBL5778285.1 hypothetical protein [Heyndrickxia sporothermodurans]
MANPNPQLDSQLHTKPLTNGNNILKFVVFSAIGIFMFFIPISIKKIFIHNVMD